MSTAGQELPDDIDVDAPLFAFIERVFLEGMLAGVTTAYAQAQHVVTGHVPSVREQAAGGRAGLTMAARVHAHIARDPLARDRLLGQWRAALEETRVGLNPFADPQSVDLHMEMDRIHHEGCDGLCQH